MRIHRSLGYGMPELDRFERSFAAGWRAAYKWAREGTASDAEISDKLIGSLARTLRERGGIPGLRELSEVVANRREASLEDSFDSIERIVRGQEGHRHTKISAEVTKFVLVSGELDAKALESSAVTEQLARLSCTAIMEHEFFGKARPNLISEGRLGSQDSAYEWQRRIEQVTRLAVEKLAGQLADNPSAVGLRAPRRSVPREPTSSLLGENLRPSRSLTRASSGPSR